MMTTPTSQTQNWTGQAILCWSVSVCTCVCVSARQYIYHDNIFNIIGNIGFTVPPLYIELLKKKELLCKGTVVLLQILPSSSSVSITLSLTLPLNLYHFPFSSSSTSSSLAPPSTPLCLPFSPPLPLPLPPVHLLFSSSSSSLSSFPFPLHRGSIFVYSFKSGCSRIGSKCERNEQIRQ